MKQLFLERGIVKPFSVPEPHCGPHDVLIQVNYSFISTGTEYATMINSSQSLFKKFFTHLSINTCKLVGTVKEHGLASTILLAKEKSHQKIPLGYSCSGQAITVGHNVKHVRPGDYVACAGAGYANHAEKVVIPGNLVTRLHNNSHLREASLTTIGAIALQGLRRAELHLGEHVCVIGMGIIGQLTAQLAKASGCKVIAVDIDNTRLERARKINDFKTISPLEEDIIQAIHYATQGFGVDATIITAAAATGDLIQQAMMITRKKGKVVLVGDVKIDVPRDPFYTKEIDFLISCSYGPGRYDQTYEKQGADYPYGYVRWTEGRNMACITDMIENGTLSVAPLIDHEIPFNEAHRAYEMLNNKSALGITLTYGTSISSTQKTFEPAPSLLFQKKLERINLACIGAGGFAKTKLLPLIVARKDTTIHTIIDTDPATLLNISALYKAQAAANDYHEALTNPSIDAVIIATPHAFHAQQIIDTLKANKAVFVEKPAAVNNDQLATLTQFLSATPHKAFCVDFNRSYSPFMQRIAAAISQRSGPLMIFYRMNVGFLDQSHWIQSPTHGGRIIGEGCHIFDLFLFLTQSTPKTISVQAIPPQSNNFSAADNIVATITMADESVCSLTYTAQGNQQAGKEYMEIHVDGKTIIMDDFISLSGFGFSRSFNKKTSSQDKGHAALLYAFFDAVKQGSLGPIPTQRILQATEISLVADSLARGKQIFVG